MRFIKLLILSLVNYFSLASLVGNALKSIRYTPLGANIPLVISSETNDNDSPVLIKRASIEDARYYANLAGASFCRDETLSDFSCEPYCKKVILGTAETSSTESVQVMEILRDTLSGIRGYVARIPERKEVILALAVDRPQSSKFVVLTGLLKPYDISNPDNNNKNIRAQAVAVHGPLYDTAYRLVKQAKPTLMNLLQDDRYKLMVTGHSAGAETAALTTIVAHDELNLSWDRMRYIGYGMVRVGNREFVRWFNQQRLEASHVVNYNDKVVKILRQAFNFQHFANEIFIDENGQAQYCNNDYFEDPKCSRNKLDIVLKESHNTAFRTAFGLEC